MAQAQRRAMQEPLAELFRNSPREVVSFLRVLMGVGTATSIGMLLYSFPTIYWFDYAFKARKNLTNWILYWWLGGVCAVQFVQIPLRLRMHFRLWTEPATGLPLTGLPRERIVRELADMMESIEWRLIQYIGKSAYALFVAGSVLTSFAGHLADEHDNDLHTTVLVSLIALAARIAFSFCWFFYNFIYRNDMPAILGVNGRAASQAVIDRTLKVFAWPQKETASIPGGEPEPSIESALTNDEAAAVQSAAASAPSVDDDVEPDETCGASRSAKEPEGTAASAPHTLASESPSSERQSSACGVQSSCAHSQHEHELRTECPVCLADFVAGETVAALPCSPAHVFHQHCIIPWLKVEKRCPLCTADIDEPPLANHQCAATLHKDKQS